MSRGKWAVVAIVATCLVVTAAAVAYAAGKAKPAVPVQEVLRAKRFELVDGKGRTRGLLALTESGSPGLWLTDANGKALARIWVETEGAAAMSLGDPIRTRLELGASDDGAMVLLTASKGPKHRSASLDCSQEYLGLDLSRADIDENGARLRGGASLRVDSGGGSLRVDGPQPRLSVVGASGRPLWLVPDLGTLGQGTRPSLVLPRIVGSVGYSAYAGVGSGHWVSEVMDDGRLVKLEDDSLWEVAPLDRINTALWLGTTQITVLDGDDPLYPYKLVNTDDGEVANAKLVSQ